MTVAIADVWDCVADAEQDVAVMMADASQSMVPYVLMAVIDASFAANSPGWYETRRDAWLNCWDITTQEIEIMGDMVAVALADQPWMAQLFNCRLMSGCPDGQEDCKQLTFSVPG